MKRLPVLKGSFAVLLSLLLIASFAPTTGAHTQCDDPEPFDPRGYYHCHTGYDHEHGHYETQYTNHYHNPETHYHSEYVTDPFAANGSYVCKFWNTSHGSVYGCVTINYGAGWLYYSYYHPGFNHVHEDQVWVVDEIHHHEPYWHFHQTVCDTCQIP